MIACEIEKESRDVDSSRDCSGSLNIVDRKASNYNYLISRRILPEPFIIEISTRRREEEGWAMSTINRTIWTAILCCILANTGSAAATALDFNGDGRSDFAVVRNTGGGSSGQMTWFTKLSGGHPTSTRSWGVASDIFLAADFDGDAKCDIAVWRPSNGTFYIVESNTLTIRIDQLGQNGDDPTIVGDYNGDGKADVAVFRRAIRDAGFIKRVRQPTSRR